MLGDERLFDGQIASGRQFLASDLVQCSLNHIGGLVQLSFQATQRVQVLAGSGDGCRFENRA